MNTDDFASCVYFELLVELDFDHDGRTLRAALLYVKYSRQDGVVFFLGLLQYKYVV